MTNLITTGFCELNEQEMIETDGGGIIGLISDCINANKEKKAAEQRANDLYNSCRNDLISQINSNPSIITSVPAASISYFNIHGTNGGAKGVVGGIY